MRKITVETMYAFRSVDTSLERLGYLGLSHLRIRLAAIKSWRNFYVLVNGERLEKLI